jgi:hypothetical protein
MDNHEAKFILSAYRPGGQDADDPRFSNALAQARRDPALGRWFNDSIAFDRAVTEKLCAAEVPSGLRESILAGGKVSLPARWTKPFVTWPTAAVLALLAIAGSLLLRESARPSLAGWQTNALSIISSVVKGESRFDFQAHSATELVNWLSANHAPVAQKIPGRLAGLHSLGCKIFSWNGIPASVICFLREDGGLVHLVVTRASKVSRAGTPRDPHIVVHGPWTTATWREGDKICMIALEGSRDQLRSFLL